MSLDPEVQLQIGDLIDCMFYNARNWGVIEQISDGSERGYPGELMYYVSFQNRDDIGPLWLHRWEIFSVLDPEAALKETVEKYYERILGYRRKVWNNMIVDAILKQEAERKFKGVL